MRALPPFPAPPPAPAAPRVSVVVNNHDYGRFVADAIESALAAGPDVEVVVVDDGSTDGSREVIARYDGRVRTVLQPNLGQRAAFNAGFEAATGDVVLFLDADDLLAPGIAATVAAAYAAQPGCARIVYRLQVVDEWGVPEGTLVPAELSAGDLRPRVLAHPDDVPWPPTSGNAFPAWVLRRLLPLPVDGEKIAADMLLHPLAPLYGTVVALPAVGGSYRRHGSNAHLRGSVDLDRSRAILRWAQEAHRLLAAHARELGYPEPRPRSVTLAVHRLVSLRLGPERHPVANDGRRRALAAGVAAALCRDDLPLPRRLAYAAWFGLAAFAPVPLVRPLAAYALGRRRR